MNFNPKHKCLPCGLCTEDSRSLTGACPTQCTEPVKVAKKTGNKDADAKAEAALLKEQQDMEREEKMWRKETEVREEQMKKEEERMAAEVQVGQ